MKRIFSVAVVLLVALAAAEAQAQYGTPGYGGYGFSYGYGYNGYSIYDQDRLPYFSLHPPVYYSYPPVPRTFGYSPFAYPGWVMTPELGAADPETMVNPYYDPSVPGEAVPNTNPGAMPAKPGAPSPGPTIKKSQLQASQAADKSAEAKPLRIVNPHFGPLVSLQDVK